VRIRIGRIAAIAVLVAIASAAGCRFLLSHLPERYAVNAPLGYMLFGSGAEPPAAAEVRERLRVPDGFSIALYAQGIPNARFLRFTPTGDLLVSTPRSGQVMILLRDENGDGRPDAVRPLLGGLERPHGLDFHDGWLYIGEGDAIARVRYDAAARLVQGGVERLAPLPSGGNHWTRTLRFGPDGLLYVTVGSSCNACIESDPHRAVMLRYRPDATGEEIYASGLRNSVGFDWQPGSGDLYATDNGRDLLGDDVPPCELNRIVRGGFYGWPFAMGDRVPDPELGAGHEAEIAASLPPAHRFRAHNAPLGMTFLRSAALAETYRGAALVALHGSWNRTHKDGYKVVSLHWRPDGSIEERDFATGFLRGEEVIGRPVDVAEGPDGAIYVSDDYAGAIYRITPPGDGGPRPVASEAMRSPGASPQAAEGGAQRAEGERSQQLEGERISSGRAAAQPPTDAASARLRGLALWEANGCARCHDPTRAQAGVVPVPLAGLAARYDVEGLRAFLAAPTPPMPAFPLDDAERRDLAVFLLAEHGS
jgi:glucose/arabinose dehydrogenase/cytochrome c553